MIHERPVACVLLFRGGTALHKIVLTPPARYFRRRQGFLHACRNDRYAPVQGPLRSLVREKMAIRQGWGSIRA